jgi:hypothetical protein
MWQEFPRGVFDLDSLPRGGAFHCRQRILEI